MATAPLPPIKKFLSTSETACALGIIRNDLMKHIERGGNPPGIVIGGRYMFFDPDFLDELREWLREQGVEFRSTYQPVPDHTSPEISPDQGERERQAVLNKYGHKPQKKPQPATV